MERRDIEGGGHGLTFVLSWHFSGGKPMINLSWHSQSLGSDLCQGPREYIAGVLPTHLLSDLQSEWADIMKVVLFHKRLQISYNYDSQTKELSEM
jgi:hypothetical protein